ncbi:HsdR family type I site-specific deoxyribonuclease [Campylobacter sp. RM16190]|uniref:type I restriction endonuclease subunit R n=1 Tax=Campylobacter sp. RM16190 TaxID=1705727 RepID=UPI001472F4FF|nr:HsdR family type I site-specific deoxyribonuclease [Campylobacter sp. RM16190]
MTPNISEKALQQNCINLLTSELFGYKFISRDENLKLRDNQTSNVLFKEILAKKLNELNSYEYKGEIYKFSPQSITRAIEHLDVSLNEGLGVANERVTNMLLMGESYEESLPDGSKRSFSIKFIDFENIYNNDFYITEEFAVAKSDKSDKKSRRPDLVLFVNGIPLAVIELKKSSISVQNGINQLLKEQEKGEIPHLFKFIQLTLAANANEARYGTTGTKPEFYSIWKEEEEESARENLAKFVNDRSITALDMTLYALLRPDRLLDLMRNFILFDNRVKKICRYQQFFGIKRTLKRVERIEDGKRTGGLIWHTQGSGKSLTMVMLTKLLKQIYTNSKVIIVSDRIELDKQIEGTFKNTDIRVERCFSGANLTHKLKSNVGVITTLVHKFASVANSKTVLNDNNIFVLVDESHRTQGGDLHIAMRRALPNACYIGFTGTPLLKREKNSFAKFGGEIHRYTIDDAVRDGAVLPLLYEGRFVEQEISNPEILDERFKAICRNLSDEQKRDLQQKWAKFSKVASSEQRLYLVAMDINKHFKEFAKPGFKAMFATSSKFEAIKYHQIFKDLGEIKTAFVISNEQDENVGVSREFVINAMKDIEKEYGDNERYIDTVKDEFLNGDDMDMLIVVDKLLTGFDAPRAAILYVDKPLKEHNLLQAIARVNRVYEDKDYGLIIDYRGLLRELSDSLESYECLSGFDGVDIVGAVIDVRSEISKVKTYYTHLEELFKDVEFKNDVESYAKSLDDKDKRKNFKEWLSSLARAFALALSSDKTAEILTGIEIKEYKSKIKFYNELRSIVQIMYQEKCDFNKYEKDMQKLLDTFINAKGVNTLSRIVNIFEAEFDSEVDRLVAANAKAESIKSALDAVVTEKFDSNPAFYRSISAQIQKIIDEYTAGRLSDEEKLTALRAIKEQIVNKKDEMKEEFKGKRSIADMYENLADLTQIDEEELVALAQKIDEIYSSYALRPEWDKNIDVKNEIEGAIDELLWDIEDKFDINIENKTQIYEVMRNIGINHYA